MALFSQDFKRDFPATFAEVEAYIQSTFNQHYVGAADIQTTDVWENLNIIREAFISSNLRYMSRYGKKEGLNKKDLLKIIHYTMMLLYFDHYRPDTSTVTQANDSKPRKGN